MTEPTKGADPSYLMRRQIADQQFGPAEAGPSHVRPLPPMPTEAVPGPRVYKPLVVEGGRMQFRPETGLHVWVDSTTGREVSGPAPIGRDAMTIADRLRNKAEAQLTSDDPTLAERRRMLHDSSDGSTVRQRLARVAEFDAINGHGEDGPKR